MSSGSQSVPRSRTARKVYAFGSSTPRYLSYLDQVPAQYRIYNSKVRYGRKAGDPTLADYMREARFNSPYRKRDRSLDSSMHSSWAFGSSTPRDMSYLEKLSPDFRVYDTRLIPINGDKRSKTTSFAQSSSGATKRYVRRTSSMNSVTGGSAKKRPPSTTVTATKAPRSPSAPATTNRDSSQTAKPVQELTADQKVPEPTTEIVKETEVTSVTTIKLYTAPDEVPDQTEVTDDQTEQAIVDSAPQSTVEQEALEKVLDYDQDDTKEEELAKHEITVEATAYQSDTSTKEEIDMSPRADENHNLHETPLMTDAEQPEDTIDGVADDIERSEKEIDQQSSLPDEQVTGSDTIRETRVTTLEVSNLIDEKTSEISQSEEARLIEIEREKDQNNQDKTEIQQPVSDDRPLSVDSDKEFEKPSSDRANSVESEKESKEKASSNRPPSIGSQESEAEAGQVGDDSVSPVGSTSSSSSDNEEKMLEHETTHRLSSDSIEHQENTEQSPRESPVGDAEIEIEQRDMVVNEHESTEQLLQRESPVGDTETAIEQHYTVVHEHENAQQLLRESPVRVGDAETEIGQRGMVVHEHENAEQLLEREAPVGDAESTIDMVVHENNEQLQEESPIGDTEIEQPDTVVHEHENTTEQFLQRESESPIGYNAETEIEQQEMVVRDHENTEQLIQREYPLDEAEDELERQIYDPDDLANGQVMEPTAKVLEVIEAQEDEQGNSAESAEVHMTSIENSPREDDNMDEVPLVGNQDHNIVDEIHMASPGQSPREEIVESRPRSSSSSVSSSEKELEAVAGHESPDRPEIKQEPSSRGSSPLGDEPIERPDQIAQETLTTGAEPIEKFEEITETFVDRSVVTKGDNISIEESEESESVDDGRTMVERVLRDTVIDINTSSHNPQQMIEHELEPMIGETGQSEQYNYNVSSNEQVLWSKSDNFNTQLTKVENEPILSDEKTRHKSDSSKGSPEPPKIGTVSDTF